MEEPKQKIKAGERTQEQNEQILFLLKRAVALQAQRWDAEREIELIVGMDFELSHSESFIKDLAFNVDPPDYATDFVTLSDVDALLADQEER